MVSRILIIDWRKQNWTWKSDKTPWDRCSQGVWIAIYRWFVCFYKMWLSERSCRGFKKIIDTEYVKIFNNGVKVYVVPSNLSKGTAIKRLRNRFNPTCIIATGNSEFDVSMVEEADYGLVPAGFVKTFGVNKKLFETEEGMLFSDELLKKCLKINAELKWSVISAYIRNIKY